MEDYLDGALEALGLDKNRRDQFLQYVCVRGFLRIQSYRVLTERL